MRTLDLIVSAAIASVVAVFATTVVNMAAAELQGRLDVVCFVLLRLARRRLPAGLREPLHDEEWLPELHYILRREEARPITRLVQGSAYALGLLVKTRSVAAEVGQSRSTPNTSPEQATTGHAPARAAVEAADRDAPQLAILQAAAERVAAERAAAERAAAERAAADLQAAENKALLDEIDDLLEGETEDWVKQYLRKGGR